MGYALISYSSIYRESADDIRDIFMRNDIGCWMAPYDIPSGSDYAGVINDAIENCACFVLLLTDSAQRSQWVKKEVGVAVSSDKTIVTVKLDDAELNSSFKLYLQNTHIERVTEISESNAEMKKILDAVSALTGKSKKPAGPKDTSPDIAERLGALLRNRNGKLKNMNVKSAEQDEDETQLPDVVGQLFGETQISEPEPTSDFETTTGLTQLGDEIERFFGDAFAAPAEQSGVKPQSDETTAQIADDVHNEEPEVPQSTPVKLPDVGSSIYLGRYRQSDVFVEKEPIEWIVLDKKGSKALLISKYALDCKQYNSSLVDTTWETCSLRTWLNGEFLDTAFNFAEKEKIVTVNVQAHKNPRYDTDPGNATYDKVFLLSIQEAEKYFPGYTARCAAPTSYAVTEGCWTSDEYKTEDGEAACWWWLRSPGNSTYSASSVYNYGVINYNYYVTNTGGGVRPALWLNLENPNNEWYIKSIANSEHPASSSKKTKKRMGKGAIAALVISLIVALSIILATIVIPKHKKTPIEESPQTAEAGNEESPPTAEAGNEESPPTAEDGNEESPPTAEDDNNESLTAVEIGDIVIFGNYEQDNNITNGKEETEWLVLDKQDGKVLLISKYALGCKEYNSEAVNVTWETCTLRKWLNVEFINNAFSADEQKLIQTTTVSADKNPDNSTDPGNATNDKVFLLSITEAEKYFVDDEARKCAPTEYAKAQGAYSGSKHKTESGEDTCWWWLRSPGDDQSCAAIVNTVGWVSYDGSDVCRNDDAVRPALWVDLEA